MPIIGFCDDTVLMATLISHLRKFIEECDNYSKKWMLKYNVRKSVIINCSGNITKDEDINIKMNDVRIPVVRITATTTITFYKNIARFNSDILV